MLDMPLQQLRNQPRSHIIGIGIIAILVLTVIVMQAKNHSLQSRLQEMSGGTKASSQAQNAAIAKDIVVRVRKLYDLPAGVEPMVAKIADVEALKKRDPVFYAKAKNGDYVVVTVDRALLYDPEKNMLLDVAPVQPQAEKKK